MLKIKKKKNGGESKSMEKLSSSVHFILQGKGGAGKTFISTLIAQWIRDKNIDLKCYDTDNVNATFEQYQDLQVEHITIMDGNKINERGFDDLMESLFTQNKAFVIDNGASSFAALNNYMIENGVMEMLKSHGKEVFIHTVLTGAQGIQDTAQGFKSLITNFSNVPIIVWKNEYFGKIEIDDKTFEDTKLYRSNIVTIAQRNRDTFIRDLEEMVKKKLTFNEVKSSPAFKMMEKQRLNIVKKDIFTQLDEVFGV